jgi:hypothetical protein
VFGRYAVYMTAIREVCSLHPGYPGGMQFTSWLFGKYAVYMTALLVVVSISLVKYTDAPLM